MSKLNLAVCASASFYSEVIVFSDILEREDINVILPATAAKMKREDRANEEVVVDWSSHPDGYGWKAELIRGHFDEITECDAILVMNYEKHGKKNYIGPNVLMEMAIAFYLKKPIYVLNGVPEDSPLLDEILGLQPVFLGGDISRIRRN